MDLTSKPLERAQRPGTMISCINYEVRGEGYQRIEGYERFDGRQPPSEVSEDLSDEDQDQIEGRRRAIGRVPGSGEILAVYRFGSNGEDRTYAWRQAADSDCICMYESSDSGWQPILTGGSGRNWQAPFEDGTGARPQAGETFQASGTDAVEVLGVIVDSGSFQNGNAEGTLIYRYTAEPVNGVEGAFFGDNPPAFVGLSKQGGEASSLNITGAVEQMFAVAADGGRWQFVTHNFSGQSTSRRMYGITSGGTLFEFDGSTLLMIETGLPAESQKPVALAAHENHLFIGYEQGSVIYSGTAMPRSFLAADGAGEIATGDDLSGLIADYKGAMVIYGRNSTRVLTGSSHANFAMRTVSGEAGAIGGTVQLMDEPICFDDRGVRTFAATEAYGDFAIGVVSDHIRPLLDQLRDGDIRPVCSLRCRRKSQYRVFFSDGSAIVLSWVLRGKSTYVEFSTSLYDLYPDEEGVSGADEGIPSPPRGAPPPERLAQPAVLTDACSVEDINGRERIFCIFAGSGYVYEMDKGASFDGQPIQAHFRLPYNDLGAPEMLKVFKRLELEADSAQPSKVRMTADKSDDAYQETIGREYMISGEHPQWDATSWNNFEFDGMARRVVRKRMSGRGRNLSLAFHAAEDVQPRHTLSGVTIYFMDRRERRG